MTVQQQINPFELHTHGGGGFTVFESGDAVGLPLIQLGKATLRSPGGQRMLLEFGATHVVVEGEGLAELYGHLLAGRVKTIRKGRLAGCIVTAVQILDV
jgi:hypothetical protein